MTRLQSRRLRACLHRCELLEDSGAGRHEPRRMTDRLGWYPFPAGARRGKVKNSPADIRTKLVTERIDVGRPKGRRKIKYTRLSRNTKIRP